ncbi:MAG: DNRLRE domain-containing protein, partial [Chloroflexi bacterium]|nr:DNRLRE domain-containing protein [Chloroflexota bacterium]
MFTYFRSTGTFASQRSKFLRVMLILIFITSLIGASPVQPVQAADDAVTFAVITDYGFANDSKAPQVAKMVDGWNPDFIVTTGDNWQGSSMGSTGSTNSYENVVGNVYGAGGVTNDYVSRNYLDGDFYPVKGNHDYMAGSGRFEQYFSTLPFVEHSGTARFYEVRRGPVHFFMLDTGQQTSGSSASAPNLDTQKAWLQNALAASTAAWQIVVFHKPAYTGGMHGSAVEMQWPYAEWGADFVLAGHVHIYERITRDGVTYFTAGAGASDARTGSQIGQAYYSGTGAMRVNASETSITFEYVSLDTKSPVDTYTKERSSTGETGSLWTAYNDLAWESGQLNTNITTYTIPSKGTSSGKLVDYETGAETPATVTITTSGSSQVQTGTYGGSESSSGTDAYNTFHGIVDMAGVVQYSGGGGSGSAWSVELTFSGLSPSQTYTFATTGNRGDTGYNSRISRFTISEVDAAVNVSTQGVTVLSNESVEFSTGNNTANGYVARWTGINPGADGTFKVRVEPNPNEYRAYGPSVFMLQAEGSGVTHTLDVTSDGNGTVNLSPSGGVYAEGTKVTLTPVPNQGYIFSHWSGQDAGDVKQSGGAYSIVMDADKAVTANFTAIGECSQVSLVAEADTYLRKSQSNRNYGGATVVQVSPFTTSPQNALFRWDLSSIPAGAVITDASLTFNVTDGSAYPVKLYKMRRAWVEGTSNDQSSSSSANWDTYDGKNNWGSGGAESTSADRYDINLWTVATNAFNNTGSRMFVLNADGVAAVQSWVNNPQENFGLTAQRDTAQSSSSNDYWIVSSSEASDQNQRPKLNVTYCLPSSGPSIITSKSTLPAFTSQPGTPSAAQSYTVSASNLSEPLVITAPDNFQISLSESGGFGPSITLTPSSGAVPTTTIYVRFNPADEGPASGVINHTSSGADPKVVSVSGTAAFTPPWTAYNDMSGESDPPYTTEYGLDQPSGGELLDFDTGVPTGVTVRMVINGSLYNLTSAGQMPNAGTDAYNTFNGKADMSGVIMSDVQNPTDYTADLVFEGLDPNKTYTFATSVNRAGGTTGGDPAYTNRYTRYTIMNMAAATNASTEGVGVYDANGHSVYFCTGENTQNGYVARWVNIKPNAQGSFTVRAQPHDPAIPRVYAYGVFMLQEEASPTKTVTVTAHPKSKVYGEADPELTYTVSDESVELTGALSREPGEDVDTYAITQGTLSAGPKYKINFESADFTITPKPITVTADSGQGKVYGNADPDLTYTVSGLVGDDELNGALSRKEGEDAGTYAIEQGDLSAGQNYTITFVGADFTITPKPITVTAEDKSKVYGDADPELTYKVGPGSLAFDDKFSGALSRVAGEAVGEYKITQGTLSLSDNYDMTFVEGKLTITPKAITVTVDPNQSKVYGDPDPELIYTVSEGELVGDDELTGALSRAAGENVGTYAITQGNLSAGSNYTIDFKGADFTITPRPITVTAQDKSKVYGYADPKLTYTVSENGLVGDDELTGALSRAAGEDVGTYAIMQGNLSNSNYDITFVGADFTITRRAITVTAENKSKVFGDPDPELTYTYSPYPLPFDDEFSGALARKEGESVGTYAITQGTLSLSSNYDMTFVEGKLTIAAQSITVTVNPDQSKVYGEKDPVFTYTVSDESVELTGA